MALANIGPGAKGAAPALTNALRQAENPNAHVMVFALGRIGPGAAEADPVLTELLKNSDHQLALVSAWALVQIHPASAEVAAKTLPLLLMGLTDNLPLARQGAAEALGALGPAAKQAIPALQKMTGDEDKAVRAAAAKAIELISKGPANKK